MPNHFHCVLALTNFHAENASGIKTNLSEAIRQFKTFSARRINLLRATAGIPVWQRNYFERIIRNQEELDESRRYFSENPANWKCDAGESEHFGYYYDDHE
jgi:putative transposase